MKISVIVPAYNEEKLLAVSLAAIRSAAEAFRGRGWDFELVVCDNNSTDRTAEIARAAGAMVVFEPFNQIGRARNSGATAATGDWLLFIDADSQPSVALFGDVAEAIASGRCLAGGSTVRLDERMLASDFFTHLWNFTSRFQRLLAGSFIFVPADVFRKTGGFSDKFFAAEELELSLRLKALAKERGRKIVILNRHPLQTSARKMKLYTGRELGTFMLRTLFNRRRMLSSREEAYIWYDGRR